MITKMRKVSVAGFSLVELMVVVAIIGILAAVAIPNFNKFQRRARAAENKAALSGIFNNQKSFLGEWEDYSNSFAAIGYSFDGTPRTEAGIGDGMLAAARYVNEAVVASATTLNGMFNTISGVCGDPVFGMGCTPNPVVANRPLAWGGVPAGAVELALGAMGVAGTWTAAAATNVGSSADEIWTINTNKIMTQTADGINAN